MLYGVTPIWAQSDWTPPIRSAKFNLTLPSEAIWLVVSNRAVFNPDAPCYMYIIYFIVYFIIHFILCNIYSLYLYFLLLKYLLRPFLLALLCSKLNNVVSQIEQDISRRFCTNIHEKISEDTRVLDQRIADVSQTLRSALSGWRVEWSCVRAFLFLIKKLLC